MRVLDIGAGNGKTCRRQFPEADIVTLDADANTHPDIVHDITTPFLPALGKFDAVYCSHVLEHIDRVKVLPTIKNIADVLVDGGDFYVIVPALEWAMAELMKPKPSPVVIAHIFGQQDTPYQYHRCGFTLPMLRRVCMTAGLAIIAAQQGNFLIDMEGGGSFPAVQDIVVARKVSKS
jgi:predicted SAM-dependent methyltransferase